MSKPIIPISQSIYDAKGDQLTYSTWLKINRALASASGAGGSTDLGPISGLLASTSGYLEGLITSTSGYLLNGYITADAALSGTLAATINNISGQIPTYFYTVISGSLYNSLTATTVSGVIKYPVLNVNGMSYFEDVGTSGGFTINYSGGDNTNYLKWNFTNNTGFTLEDTDTIILRYQR